jgi:hypothetical protein
MTLDTSQCGMGSRQRIVGVRCVVEVDIGPVRRGMASVAGGGEAGRDVVGVGGAIPIRLVAAVAIGGKRGVVIVYVAFRARDGRMSTH